MNVDFPLWIDILCTIIWVIIVLLILRGLYKNYLINLFSKKKKVKAELISKVEEEYYETKVYAHSPGRAIGSPDSGLRSGRSGIAYRLYFRVQKKVIELDVDKATFQTLPDTGIGLLEYRGNIYYSFILVNSFQ